ncbi:CoA transferase [Rubrobacter xylanophilus]|uniref:CoA transferase n=1 Tax=Rubrobacter xylanophilus TaxID=49319 RepID=A0A510HNQ1_9ACTN|nr:CoA transferase [Rubrobacter xylanophilus]BBL80227.1 CoA transferase [Rubrobacter xylanophilus]
MSGGPLAGIRVVDLTRALAGPYATMMLADAGAEVIKIERPGTGDDTRGWGPPFVGGPGEEESTYFLSVNRSKKSVVLDLKDPDDLERLKGLIRRADVLAENFRPGVMERLGLGPEDLERLNPRLVSLSITGFGEGGPEGHRPGFDQIAQGEGGLMSFTGPVGGPPTKVGVPIADILAGMFGAFGVVAALHERERSGRGQRVTSSLLGAIVGIHAFQGTRWLIAGEVPRPEGNRHPTIAPYGAYECADGMINIAVGSEGLWRRFAPLVGLDPDDERFDTNKKRVSRVEELEEAMAPALRAAGVEEWMRRLGEAGVPAGRVLSLDEVYAAPQVEHLGLVDAVEHPRLGEIRLPGWPVGWSRSGRRRPEPPPILGQHGDEVLGG